MRKLLLVAAMLSAVPSAASATDWYRIGGNAKTMSYVDLDSLRPIGGKIIALTKSVYASPLDGDVFASMIRSEYDCAGNYFRTLEYSYYGEGDRFMSSEASQTINEHKTPKPDSINQSMLEFICYRKGGVQVSNPYADAQVEFAKY